MASAPEELADVCRFSKALNVNIGTLDAKLLPVMVDAVRIMRLSGQPAVLDPVGVGISDFRLSAALSILAMRPRIIRANAGEIGVLVKAFDVGDASSASGADHGAGGVDALISSDFVSDGARRLADRLGATVIVTGEHDLVTDGSRLARISGGAAMMTRITGGGCALSAVVAACAAVEDDAYRAALAACAVYKGAAAVAAKRAGGPGSLASGLLDALHSENPAELIANATIMEPD